MGGAQSELKPAGDAKSAKRSERLTATAPLAASKTSKSQVDTKKIAGKPSKPNEEKSASLDLVKTAKQFVHLGGKSSLTNVAEQMKTAREVSPRAKSFGKKDIDQMKTAKDVSPKAKHSSTREVAQPKTAKEVSPRAKPSDKMEIAQAKTAKLFVWPKAKPSIAAELDQTKTAKECYFASRAKEPAKAIKEPKRHDPKLISLKTAKEHKHRRPAEETTAREPSAKAAKEAKHKRSSAEAVATAQEMSAKTARDFKALRPKPSALSAQKRKEVTTPKPAPQKPSGAPVVVIPKPSGGAQVPSSAAATALTTDARKDVVAQKPPSAPVAATAGVLPRTSSDTRIATAPPAASSPAMAAARAKNARKEVIAQKPSPAPAAATVGVLARDSNAARVTSPAPEPLKPVAGQVPVTKKDVPATKPSVAQVTGDVPKTPEAKEAALPAGSSNVHVNTEPKPSGVDEKVEEKWPIEREKNIRRKPGYDYQLVTIEFQKDKKFGLMMVHTENHVIVNKVDDGSMCSDSLKYLDRICDVEGVPVTDKELTKKQIIKGLKASGKVSLAVERPVTEERKEKVERLLSMIDQGPASVMLEDDVRDILMRHLAKMKAQKQPLKAHSALTKSPSRTNLHKACVKSQIESVHIGMDREYLQEDLEKVPLKTYETSLANPKNQGPRDPNSICITAMLQTEGGPEPLKTPPA